MDDEAAVLVVLRDILSYCDKIDYLVERFGDDEETFLEDPAFQMSCIFALMQIGESVKRIEDWLISNSGLVRWKAVCRFRDFIAHNYGKAEPGMIWKMVTTDYPVLRAEIERLMSEVSNFDGRE